MRTAAIAAVLFVGLVFLDGSAPAQQPAKSAGSPTEKLELDLATKSPWRIAFEREEPGRFKTTYLTHVNENMRDWRQLVTVLNTSRPRQFADAEDAFNLHKSVIERDCAGLSEWSVISKSADSLVYVKTRTRPCGAKPPVRELGRYLLGKRNVWLLSYRAKGAVWQTGEQEKWLARLSQAKIVLR